MPCLQQDRAPAPGGRWGAHGLLAHPAAHRGRISPAAAGYAGLAAATARAWRRLPGLESPGLSRARRRPSSAFQRGPIAVAPLPSVPWTGRPDRPDDEGDSATRRSAGPPRPTRANPIRASIRGPASTFDGPSSSRLARMAGPRRASSAWRTCTSTSASSSLARPAERGVAILSDFGEVPIGAVGNVQALAMGGGTRADAHGSPGPFHDRPRRDLAGNLLYGAYPTGRGAPVPSVADCLLPSASTRSAVGPCSSADREHAEGAVRLARLVQRRHS